MAFTIAHFTLLMLCIGAALSIRSIVHQRSDTAGVRPYIKKLPRLPIHMLLYGVYAKRVEKQQEPEEDQDYKPLIFGKRSRDYMPPMFG